MANVESFWGAREFHTARGGLRYLLRFPPNYAPGRTYELWVSLHGSPGCASYGIYWFRDEAPKRDAFLLAPEATEGGGEFYLRPDGKRAEYHLWDMTADVPHVLTVLDEVLARYPIDRRCVALFGFSAGCEMGWRLLAARPEQFCFFGGVANRFKHGRVPGSEAALRRAAKHTPQFYAVGQGDPKMGPGFAVTARRLRALGFELRTANPRGVGHDFPPAIMQPLLAFFDEVRARSTAPHYPKPNTQHPRPNTAAMHSLDRTIFSFANRADANPVLDWLMPRLTNLNHALWFILFCALLAIWIIWKGGRAGRAWLICAVLAMGFGDLVSSHLIKAALKRPRPCYQVNHTGPYSFLDDRLLGKCPGSPSFPSNHATNTMAFAAVCWWFSMRKFRGRVVPGVKPRAAWQPYLWFLIPLVIGYSRLYVGVHYPTDVLGGWLVGAFVAALIVTGLAPPLLGEMRREDPTPHAPESTGTPPASETGPAG